MVPRSSLLSLVMAALVSPGVALASSSPTEERFVEDGACIGGEGDNDIFDWERGAFAGVGSSDNFGGGDHGALALARSLEAPAPLATSGGEFEHTDFWEEHGALLRRAWGELGASTERGSGRRRAPFFLSWVLEPDLDRAAATARADPTAESEAAVLSLWTEAAPSAPNLGAFRARLLTEEGVHFVRKLLDLAAESGVPTRRPNGMNRWGVILDDEVDGAVSLPELTGFVRALVDGVVRPVGRALFPADAGLGDDAEHFAFTIRYAGDGDVELREHRDASVFTLNVNLNLPGEGYGGSLLYFVDPADGAMKHLVEFEPGMALLHRGALRHAALPIESGVRQNLVIWLFGKGGDVRVASYAEHERLAVEQRWGGGLAPPLWWKEAL